MFHKAVNLEFKEGTALEVTFQSGEVKRYDMAQMFDKCPKLKALEDRDLFLSGKLSAYGIIWNDELDIEVETIYEEGKLSRKKQMSGNRQVADALLEARARAGMSQAELAAATGIDQSDISKIERGAANPSVATLKRLAEGLGSELNISFVARETA